jgi:putative spermidine/putrescine transport system permease protein
MNRETRSPEFFVLTAFFIVFVLFLYGPLSAILILSFQGPNGGLTFPLNGVSVHCSRSRRWAISAARSAVRWRSG